MRGINHVINRYYFQNAGSGWQVLVGNPVHVLAVTAVIIICLSLAGLFVWVSRSLVLYDFE